ncbi:MAG: efflux RND transporter periplasmic adaptor subunit [Candidatus Moranbacteria bacterium]|nr:efflux RND transporter periplasmic adaptor subunit [Candidatus Moranbacteria bacterium]
MKSRKPLIIGIVIVVALSGAFAYLRKPSQTETGPKEPNAIRVTVRPVAELRDTSVGLSFPGTVSQDGVATVSAGVPGTVVSSGIRLGAKVGTGTVLARIDDPAGSISSASGFRSADVREAELAVERAELSYRELKRVDGNTDSHASELDKDLARKNLDTAKASLAALLDRHVTKSPIAGTVTEASVASGDTVTTGQTLFVIDSGRRERTVRFFVSDTERALLPVGTAVSIERTPDDRAPLSGTLRSVSTTADPGSGRFLAEAIVSGNAPLSPGIPVTVRISAPLRPSATGTFFVPLSALAIGQTGTSLLTEHDGTVSAATARIVRIEGETAEVSADLGDDARIVVGNAKRIQDGDRVEIAE